MDGDNLKWEWYLDGTLVISGTGEMKNYSSNVECPWYNYSSYIKTVFIEDGVTSIDDSTFLEYNHAINVSENNPNYVSVDGVLLNKDKTTLIRYPKRNTRTEYIIPDSVTGIRGLAFSGYTSLTEITIPDSVTWIGFSAFSYCTNLTSFTILNPRCEIYDSADTICNKFSNNIDSYFGTIFGYSGSTAEAYAKKYGRTFISLDDAPQTTKPVETTTTTTTTETTTITESTTQVTTSLLPPHPQHKRPPQRNLPSKQLLLLNQLP